MARWKNINGVLQKIAGSVRIDQVLNKLSRNAISNKAVSEKFEEVENQLVTVDTTFDKNSNNPISNKSVATAFTLCSIPVKISLSNYLGPTMKAYEYITATIVGSFMIIDFGGVYSTTTGNAIQLLTNIPYPPLNRGVVQLSSDVSQHPQASDALAYSGVADPVNPKISVMMHCPNANVPYYGQMVIVLSLTADQLINGLNAQLS